MSTLRIASHMKVQMAERANLDENSLIQFAKIITPLVEQYDPKRIHQIAVEIVQLPRPVTVGYSQGDRLIFTVDIQTRIITTGFVRFREQGCPLACQFMINLNGEIIG